MNRDQILKTASMPAISPSYPKGPYRFINREYMIITYESDADAIRAAVPEPLEPNKDNLVAYEWINMPDSSGFGSYTETGCVIPCTYKGEACN
ncbi:MAG: acetoacetate decarboxylase family protein, partial [Alphaproteobacteria bacterium]|nr:acetoacetate decarboxylase family protein [Alphaproteobacteria bacterium]